MLKSIFLKSSSLLYRAHSKVYVLLNQYLKEGVQGERNFKPYILKKIPFVSKTKIIHLNGNFLVGGTSQLIIDIIENTSDEYSHKIVVPEFPNPLPYQPVDIYKYSLYELEELYNFLKKEQPAAVHIHYWIREAKQAKKFNWAAAWYEKVFAICEDLKIDIIQNVNVPTAPYHSSAVIHNVFVSNFVLENFNNSQVPASVIYPGSNFSHFKNADTLPDKCIGMVYRLDPDKLNPEAIEVFISAVKRQSDIICYIIGDGYYLDYYQQRVAEEKLEKNFVFTGVVSYSSLPDYYKKISIFVAPVHDESFGQVTPFAMSMGLCVAGYDTGALSEILGSKETLVEYGRIETLADVIVALVNNPEKRAELGKLNQFRTHNNFSVETMISQYQELYSRLIIKAS